jgi:glycosyltransferase involved in cell wall biosynthesis
MIAGTKTKFLLIASFPESILTFRGSLIASLLSRGLDVNVAAPGLPVGNALREALEAKGVQVHNIPLQRTGINPIKDSLLLWRLFLLIRTTQPDFVLGYTIKPLIYGLLSAWLARAPRRFALVTGLGFAFTGERRGFLQFLIKRLYRLALGKADKVFFQNPDDQGLFRELGILAHKTPSVVVNGSGVDLTDFGVVPLPDSPPKFLMIARLLGDKGVREYAKAAREIRNGNPDIRFGLVGWIDENPDAISKAELDDWVSEGTIEFHGRLDDVRPAIADTTVYVLPSYREGTPRTVLEAMAMGRPIITTDAPGCRETVIDGENGFLVPTQSVDPLVAAMQKFIDDPALAERMGKRSREIAEDKYDVHKVNAVMLREMGIT